VAASDRSSKPPPPPGERPVSLRKAPPPAGAPAAAAPGVKRAPAAARRGRRRPALPAGINLSATAVAVTGAVVLLVLGILAYGYWDTYMRPPRETAVAVGGRSYDVDYFTRRLRAALNDPIAPPRSGEQVAQLLTRLAKDITEEEVLLQRAGQLGIAVSDEDIDGAMAERLLVPYTRDQTGKIIYTPAFENGVRNYLRTSGLTLEELRRAIHGQQLRQAARAYFEQTLPEALPAVRLRQITLPSEDQAKAAREQVKDSAAFDQMLAALGQTGGAAREWAAKGLLPTAVEEAAYRLPLGEVSDPIKNGDQYVLIIVDDRTDTRQLTDSDRGQIASKQLADWLAAQGKELKARSYLDVRERLDYALRHSGALEVTARARSAGGPLLPVNVGGTGQPAGGGGGR
jgi:parvulin-like peptidyl-prolyl isomerase